jgi:hypothetical protein
MTHQKNTGTALLKKEVSLHIRSLDEPAEKSRHGRTTVPQTLLPHFVLTEMCPAIRDKMAATKRPDRQRSILHIFPLGQFVSAHGKFFWVIWL